MQLINLHSEWSLAWRRIYITSAIGGFVDRNGKYIKPVVTQRNETGVLATLRLKLPKQSNASWEPRWHDAKEFAAMARHLKLSNETSLVAAVGSNPSIEPDLRLFRNFFAHGLPRDALKLKHSANVVTPIDYLLTPVSGGASRLRTWIDELQLKLGAAV